MNQCQIIFTNMLAVLHGAHCGSPAARQFMSNHLKGLLVEERFKWYKMNLYSGPSGHSCHLCIANPHVVHKSQIGKCNSSKNSSEKVLDPGGQIGISLLPPRHAKSAPLHPDPESLQALGLMHVYISICHPAQFSPASLHKLPFVGNFFFLYLWKFSRYYMTLK